MNWKKFIKEVVDFFTPILVFIFIIFFIFVPVVWVFLEVYKKSWNFYERTVIEKIRGGE